MSESTSDAILRWRAAELRAAWEAGRDAAAKACKHMRRCPFDDPAFVMDPATPCPVCGDLGTPASADEPVRCNSYAAAIRALTPPPDLPDTIGAKVRKAAQETPHA